MNKIIVECYSDAQLIKILGFTKKQIRHEVDRGRVIHRLENIEKLSKKLKENIEKAIGLIDEEKFTGKSSSKPKEMENYEKIETCNGIVLLIRKGNKNKKLIIILSRLEDWLLYRAKRNNILPKDFGLPDNPEKLHEIRADKLKNYQQFMKELAKNDYEVKTLKTWIDNAVSN